MYRHASAMADLIAKNLEEGKIGHGNVHVVAVHDTGLAAAEPEEGMAQGLAPVQFEWMGSDANYLGDLSHPGNGQGHVVMATPNQHNQIQIYCGINALKYRKSRNFHVKIFCF